MNTHRCFINFFIPSRMERCLGLCLLRSFWQKHHLPHIDKARLEYKEKEISTILSRPFGRMYKGKKEFVWGSIFSRNTTTTHATKNNKGAEKIFSAEL